MNQAKEKKINEYQKFISEFVVPRDYPWRFDKDPYKILVSEFMLHRTRANQVSPIYEEFIKKYPAVENFIEEADQKIFDQLKSLGLFWRIRGLINAVRQLYEIHKKIPLDYDSLLDIDGIGPYIAGAVVCFAGNQPVPLIDTNTVRVVGRVFGINLIGEARRRKVVRDMISATTPGENPRRYYYSVIDLAHEVCHKRKPLCENCPLNHICIYYAQTTRKKISIYHQEHNHSDKYY